MPRRELPPEPERLGALKRAHGAPTGPHSPRVEDYVEVIYELILEKGYARIVDIGAHLHVSSPTVTKMIQRLHEEGLVVYERYRGVVLTEQGEGLARAVRHRHGVVTDFLRLLGLDDATAHRDAEGIEHHLGERTLARMAELVEFAAEEPDWWRKFAERRKRAGR